MAGQEAAAGRIRARGLARRGVGALWAIFGAKQVGHFVGQWAPTLLILGLLRFKAPASASRPPRGARARAGPP